MVLMHFLTKLFNTFFLKIKHTELCKIINCLENHCTHKNNRAMKFVDNNCLLL